MVETLKKYIYLIHLGKINIIHIKEFFIHLLLPPLPLSTFIKIYYIFSSPSISSFFDFLFFLCLDIG